MAVIDSGSSTAGKANVNSTYDLQVALPDATTPSRVGAIRFFSENDAGDVTGVPYMYSPETDDDFRLRIAHDTVVENVTFNHSAQQTNRYSYTATTMTGAEAGGFFTTNASSITTTGTGLFAWGHSAFTVAGGQQLYVEFTGGFTANPTANVDLEFGVFNAVVAANPFTVVDGTFFRLTSTGMYAVRVNNTSTAASPVFTFPYTLSGIYKFIISIAEREIKFWISQDGSDTLFYTLEVDALAVGNATFQQTYRWFIRQVHTGVAGGVFQAKFTDVTVSEGGPNVSQTQAVRAAMRAANGLQLQVGSTLTTGSTALVSAQNYLNSANPTAAVPTNTTSALVASALGGQFWETDTLAVTTDGIIQSYQVAAHAATPTVALKRLIIYGVEIQSFVQTALTGGGYVASWSLAFGHTSVSLATAEAAGTKAARRRGIGFQSVAAAATAGTVLSSLSFKLECPIIVNPGEFIQTVKKKVGTAPSAGVIGHIITFDCAWI